MQQRRGIFFSRETLLLHAVNEMFKIHHGNRSGHGTVEEPDFSMGKGTVGLRKERKVHLPVIKQPTSAQLPVVDVHFAAAVEGSIEIHL